MTIDKVIQYHNEVADEQSRLYSLCPCPCDGTKNCISLKNGKDMGCVKCAAEHRQLAEWLMELKDLRAEQNDQYTFIRELMDELKEAKRLLKLAVEDLNFNTVCLNFDTCKVCAKRYGISCEEKFKWCYTDEALKLIGDEPNGI